MHLPVSHAACAVSVCRLLPSHPIASNAAWYYSRAIGRLLGTLRRGRRANDRKNFSATQASVFLDGFTFRGFVKECCAEHARRMAGFDSYLLLPRLLPTVAGVALAGWRLRSSNVRN
jgi:hypothetical protein